MKLLLILAADYANITGDSKLNVMGIFNDINATGFPVRHASMHLIVKLAAELGENGESRDLTVNLMDADGAKIMNLSGKIAIPEGRGGRRPEVNAILELKDIIFPKPGIYQFVVLVDKDFKGDLPIYVNQVEALNVEQD